MKQVFFSKLGWVIWRKQAPWPVRAMLSSQSASSPRGCGATVPRPLFTTKSSVCVIDLLQEGACCMLFLPNIFLKKLFLSKKQMSWSCFGEATNYDLSKTALEELFLRSRAKHLLDTTASSSCNSKKVYITPQTIQGGVLHPQTIKSDILSPELSKLVK